MVRLTQRGSFRSTQSYFSNTTKVLPLKIRKILNHYGQKGVIALEEATPKASGLTASSWTFQIEDLGLSFFNSNVTEGIPIVVLIQYGHGTGNGGYIEGRDFINPALQPIFDQILSEIEKEMHSL